MSTLTSAQTELLGQLTALRAAVAATTAIASILDDHWFAAVEAKIRSNPSPGSLGVDGSGFLLNMCHPLRGVEWFEADQERFLKGHVEEIEADGRFALALCGVDPLRTFIPLLESRLAAFGQLPFKPHAVTTKLALLKASRSDPSFKNHLFEVGVLGDLALKGILRDIEDANTAVDGVIDVGGREILVEATNTVQEVIPRFTGAASLDPDIQIDQVVKKLRKKVGEGRQLALACGKPTILFLALTRMGADRHAATIAIRECFRIAEFAALSGVVISDSWRFQTTVWDEGVTPDTPLHAHERAKVSEWYQRP